MVVAADHVRDPVHPVVDRVREVVGRTAVGADDHHVLELLGGKLDAALDGVLPRDDPLVGHADPGRAVILVGLVLGDESLGLGAAALCAVELEACLSVPLDPEPPERPLDLLRRLRHLARRVRVLDAEKALAAAAAREQPVEKEGADAADVEEPRGRGGHADANAHRPGS